MMEIIKIILKYTIYLLNFLVLSYALYYVITGICVFFNKKEKIKRYKEKTKIAILIPARNEEKVIGLLLDSLKKQNYPKELYEVFVIPNNCSDDTKKVAMEYGATVIDCNVPITSKGEVLKYSFNYLVNNYPEYEAYCIFDADNIVHPNFLKRMNDAYLSGYKVAQGYRDSKNPSDTWISSCYSLFYSIQNFFFSQARVNIGLSASINGTGFMVTKEVIQKYGFNTVTLTEDVEFTAQCALNDVKIGFVKDAITYDEQPLKFSQSWKQRKRWSVGTMQCLYNYSGKLFKNSIKKKKFVCFDMSLFYMAPIIQVLSFGIIFGLFLYGLLGINILGLAGILYNNKFFSIFLGYIICFLISLFIVIIEKKNIVKMFKGIVTFPIFFLTWIPINILCLIKKEQVWEPIEHNRTIGIENILDVNSK